MTNYNQYQTQGNKAFSKGAEKAATKAVLIGADIFRAILNFLGEMLKSFLGK